MATAVIEHTTLARIAFGASRVTMPTLFSWLSCHKGQLSANPTRVLAAYESPMTSYAIGRDTLCGCTWMGMRVSHVTSRPAPEGTSGSAQEPLSTWPAWVLAAYVSPMTSCALVSTLGGAKHC